MGQHANQIQILLCIIVIGTAAAGVILFQVGKQCRRETRNRAFFPGSVVGGILCWVVCLYALFMVAVWPHIMSFLGVKGVDVLFYVCPRDCPLAGRAPAGSEREAPVSRGEVSALAQGLRCDRRTLLRPLCGVDNPGGHRHYAVSLPYVKLRGNRGWIEQDVRLLP